MNYAWVNPTFGFREQTTQDTPERMLAEAKRRVWLELQGVAVVQDGSAYKTAECQIWRQDPIGTVTVNGPHIDVEKALTLPPGDPWQFAWCDPVDGKRIVAENFPGTDLVEQMKHLQNVMNDSKTDVIVYATWPECVVKRSDPEPEAPAIPVCVPFETPPDSRRAGDSPDITAQRAEIESVIVLDDATKLAKVTAWALLDIASVLRESSFEVRSLADAGRFRNRIYTRKRRGTRRRHKGLWERFKLWVWGDPIEENSKPVLDGVCEFCGAPTGYPGMPICPTCAQEALDNRIPKNYEEALEMGWPSEEERSGGTPTDEEKRAHPVESRGPAPVDPSKPHVYKYAEWDDQAEVQDPRCWVCRKPQDDPIHGYTGD